MKGESTTDKHDGSSWNGVHKLDEKKDVVSAINHVNMSPAIRNTHHNSQIIYIYTSTPLLALRLEHSSLSIPLYSNHSAVSGILIKKKQQWDEDDDDADYDNP